MTRMRGGNLARRLERLEYELAPADEQEDKITVTLISDPNDLCATYRIHLPEPKPKRRWASNRERGQ